MQLIFS